MLTTVYLSSRNRAADLLRQWRDRWLEPAGFKVLSRWLDEPKAVELGPDPADQDWEDLCEADVVLCYNPLQWAQEGRGGRHTEVGVALAWNLPVIIVGSRTNVFHNRRGVYVVPDIEQAVIMLDYLRTL